ncbi:hypothetical protein N657DRAFT_626972 [Parathielavia appendiculata]|uniref:Zinc finger Mcm10/DnaG-type domain-containing protein n=1 Tax=Parathielavia appendiculata TaxID=2587402 RepID=A0AAN6YZE1_9PEZI|nr:hypothetical protein N657DRAFT_626972 [Parathielavia appendiculata]
MAAQWPPKSPHEALLSTPGGREKLRRMVDRTSPSLSPSRLRASKSTSVLASRFGAGLGGVDDALFEGGDLDEEEDEETLQLKLQAIQARLKLKKLQAAKAQKKTTAQGTGTEDGGGMRGLPLQSKLAAVRDRMERQMQDIVQVPASPVKKSQAPSEVQTSPRRVVLGIDKGLKGADVSLKRAPSQRAGNESRLSQQNGYLRRANSPLNGQPQQEASRPLTFNERLASARTEEAARQERRERVQKSRSTAFSVGRDEMEGYKAKALDLPDLPSKPQEFSREQVLSSMGKPLGGQSSRSNTAPNVRSGTQDAASNHSTPTTTGTGDSAGAIEPYSGLHLSKRILPHNVLARAVSGKKSYLLKDLLRCVKAPDWSLPDDETDIVVFAIVASKSDPRSHRPGPGNEGKPQQDRGKYMVITLVDLTYEVDLFLFNSGFDRFWKLTPGTVVAILNPGILPPPPGREATNRFGLVINSDEDTILEIGNARDIGYCKSIKKDGSGCKSWVNARRTEYCEFHTNEAVRKARSSRIELSSTAGFGGGDGPRGRHNSRQVYAKSEEDRKKGQYDRATQSHYFVSSAHRNTNPDDERVTGIADRKEREEALKRRLAQKEKERDIARRLGEMGGGAGKEYMSPAATTDQPRKWDARALGLVGRRGADQPKIHLGPAPKTAAKRKRPESSGSCSTVSGMGNTAAAAAGAPASAGGNNNNNNNRAPLGWGSTLTQKLGRMKEGERLDERRIRLDVGNPPVLNGVGGSGDGDGAAARRGDKSPVRKKTRFVTAKGIREAGRESLGEPLSAAVKTRRQVVLDDDDDDDLIIVR